MLTFLCSLGVLSACDHGAADNPREVLCFNEGWSFHLGDVASGAAVDLPEAASWRVLDLPHDWSIEGEFSEDNPSGTGGGALPGGVGWYRKVFDIPAEDEGRDVYIDFDGVYMNSEVFINGNSLGFRPFGYISFRYDLTPYLNWGGKNVIAVRVDNSDQPNSRWYSGCGIYRNVYLTKVEPVHVAHWGTCVVSEVAEDGSATVRVATTIENNATSAASLILSSSIVDMDGKVVGKVTSDVHLAALSSADVSDGLSLGKPKLWDIDNPYLYKVMSEITDSQTGTVLDVYETPFGVRYFNFDPETGFSLNGVPVKINGVCLHHDAGCLGSVVNKSAIRRQLEILKEMGCNSVRTSHNPPAPELLDLCDEMGLLVMDESFDMWRKKKTKYDYSRYFEEWYERDLTDMVVRDRNHPSIIIWSIGNEVLEQWTHTAEEELTVEQANLLLNFSREADALASDGELSANSLICIKLSEIVKSLDSTRPITAGCNEPDPSNHLFRSGALDIIGFNYHEAWFKDVPENFPGKPFIITESISGLMTRGYYRMPSDSSFIWPLRWDLPFQDDSYSCSSYDNCHVPWGTSHEETLRLVGKYDFISGQYIWTGFDYIGEPTPFGWPARSSYFGIIDLAGFPKDIYYMYQSQWTDKDVLHVFPHWNWEPGQEVDIWAYYNNADEVELFVNGRSVGTKSKGADEFHVCWRVRFEPGELRAVSRRKGATVCEQVIRTAGEPAAIRLTADRNHILADGRDLSYVTVEVVDAQGNLCPNADNLVEFDVDGAAFIAGVDNGSPISHESFKAPHRHAFYGKCLVVLQNNKARGNITLTATSKGLAATQLTLQAD